MKVEPNTSLEFLCKLTTGITMYVPVFTYKDIIIESKLKMLLSAIFVSMALAVEPN